MNNWEKSLNKFLNQYKDKDYFVGAILTGSYATGNNDENSDIDVYIVSDDSVDWRERGNINVDGYLIEYFINPIRKIKDYFAREKENYHFSTTMIFINGKILYDKNNQVQALIDLACENINSPWKEVDDFRYKSNCYSIWEGFDELDAKYKRGEDIEFSYYIFLQKTVECYFYNKQIPTIPLNKIEKIFQDDIFRKKYNIKKMPDKQFIELFNRCTLEKSLEKRIENARNLYDYLMDLFNDFDIKNYSLKSKAD